MKSVLLFLIIFTPLQLFAANFKGVEYTIEPVYGYQKLELDKPTQHSAWEYFYGARISGGYKIFNLEGMYTKTELSEVFTNPALVTRNIVEKLKLGFSTSKIFNNWSLGVLRFGVEGKRLEYQTLSGTTVTSTVKEDTYRPYVGLGLEIYLKSYAAISLGVTAVLNSIPDDYWDNDYEYTSGIKLLY